MILILADEFDAHADAVQLSLLRSDQKFFRFNLNIEALLNTEISFDGEVWHIRQGKHLASSDVSIIWARRLTVQQTLEQQNEAETPSSRIWKGEWNRALYGLYVSLRERNWINPIQNSNLADNKFYQYKMAKEVGFNIPPTIMSNSIKQLHEFIKPRGSAALKFLAQDMYRMEDGSFKGVYVNRIFPSELDKFGGAEENPVILQEYKEKSFEVRYTVIDEEHFACAIYSQKSVRTATDWRRYDIPNTPHEELSPPSEISLKVRQLMKKLGLRYGALDFIVDKEGQWWYLEVNSAGQWLWIEDLVGFPISASIADALIRGGGQQA